MDNFVLTFIHYKSMSGEYEHSSDKCEGIYKHDPENEIAITSNMAETIWIDFQYFMKAICIDKTG